MRKKAIEVDGVGGQHAGKVSADCDPSDQRSWIVGPGATAIRAALIEKIQFLRHAPTYKDDQRVLDASADVVEGPDGKYRLRDDK